MSGRKLLDPTTYIRAIKSDTIAFITLLKLRATKHDTIIDISPHIQANGKEIWLLSNTSTCALRHKTVDCITANLYIITKSEVNFTSGNCFRLKFRTVFANLMRATYYVNSNRLGLINLTEPIWYTVWPQSKQLHTIKTF